MDACMRLARRFHIWGALTHRDRKTCAVFDTLTLKALASGIPTSIVDDAKALYLRVAASVVTRGLQRQAIVASTIYISCKDHDVPRATPEIAEIFDVRRCDMTRACKRVQDLLDLRLNCTGSDDFVSRFCSRLDLTPELTGVCYHIVWRLTNLRLLLRHTPPTITGACICLVLHCTLPPPPPPTQRPPHRLDKHTLLAVAEACRMSASTIHKCFQQVFAARGVLLPRDFLVRHRVK
jgi:transcription initiation factor TFIIB